MVHLAIFVHTSISGTTDPSIKCKTCIVTDNCGTDILVGTPYPCVSW